MRVPHDEGAPDGATVDAEGFVWLAHWNGWRVTRYDPAGRVARVVRLPVQRPTCPSFGRAGLDVLYIRRRRPRCPLHHVGDDRPVGRGARATAVGRRNPRARSWGAGSSRGALPQLTARCRPAAGRITGPASRSAGPRSATRSAFASRGGGKRIDLLRHDRLGVVNGRSSGKPILGRHRYRGTRPAERWSKPRINARCALLCCSTPIIFRLAGALRTQDYGEDAMATPKTPRIGTRRASSGPSRPAGSAGALFLGTRQLRRDPEFAWASGGRPYVARSEGNGQRPNDGTWGLWYSPVRPIRTVSRTRRRAR